MMYSIFIHTHSSCDDALIMCLGQLDKYMPDVKRYVAIEKITETVKNENVILYDEDDTYTERLQNVLSQIQEDIVFYLHEDMILYDKPNFKELDRCEQYLRNHDVMMIKMIATLGLTNEVAPSIRDSITPYKFVVQPTLWKKEKLIELVKNEKYSIWEMEEKIQRKFSSLGVGYTYFTGEEKLRGAAHYDSLIFPYVATAIVKGKWNNLEYNLELSKLFDEYSIKSNREMMI